VNNKKHYAENSWRIPANLISQRASKFTWKSGKTKYLYRAHMKASGFCSCEFSLWNKSLIDGKGKEN